LIEKAKGQVPDIHVEEIDVAANPAVAVKYHVVATPAIAINGRLEFTGVPREEALLTRLREAAGVAKGTST
jgi:protein-disulfide isomerase